MEEMIEKNFEELKFKRITVELVNHDIIELARLTKFSMECAWNKKLFFEDANVYDACFYIIRDLLKQGDKSYVDEYAPLVEYFNNNELSVDWDRLSWEEKD